MTYPSAAVLVLALLCLAPRPTLGQHDRVVSIEVDQTIAGALDESAPSLLNGERFRVYSFEAEEGERYEARISATGFDPLIAIARPIAGLTELIREGYDQRIVFRSPADGVYYVVVKGWEPQAGGPFEVTLRQLPPPPEPVARVISVGDTAHAFITENDPIWAYHDWEVFYHLYSVEATAGQVLLIRMDSEDLDAFLEFGPLTGTAVEATDFDDDGGEGTNARLHVTIPASGTYGIVARTYAEGEIGTYTLSVETFVPQPVVTRPIARGEAVTATLGPDNAELASRGYYQHWTFAGNAGETVRIRMRSDELDTYLFLGQSNGAGFRELAANDDHPGDGTNSFIEFTLPETGEYVIRATTFSRGEAGAYTLELD